MWKRSGKMEERCGMKWEGRGIYMIKVGGGLEGRSESINGKCLRNPSCCSLPGFSGHPLKGNSAPIVSLVCYFPEMMRSLRDNPMKYNAFWKAESPVRD